MGRTPVNVADIFKTRPGLLAEPRSVGAHHTGHADGDTRSGDFKSAAPGRSIYRVERRIAPECYAAPIHVEGRNKKFMSLVGRTSRGRHRGRIKNNFAGKC